MDGINPDYLSKFQVNKKGVPRSPREEQIQRAANLLNVPFNRICGMTRHFPKDPNEFTQLLEYLITKAEKEGKNPAGLLTYLIKHYGK